jgi:hypothetical protein
MVATVDAKPVDAKTQTSVPDDTTAKRSTVVDTIFDFGIHWATAGLKLAKTALEETSKALANTAKTLETLAETLSHKQV